MPTFISWVLALMTLAAPPARVTSYPSFPGWTETSEQRAERYEAIARAALEVAFDPNERPLYETGRDRRARTAATLLAVAFHESGFAPDVDKGPCYQDPLKNIFRCDSGRSACLMQVHVGAGVTKEGWTRDELFADRAKCFRAGLHLLRRSVIACRDNEPEEKLAAYAGGSCKGEKARRAARELFGFADRWIRLRKPPVDALFVLAVANSAG
jgi:hypothetical protein